MIKVQNLTIGWDDFVLMKDLNFEIQRGDVFVILGGSGCGKSTLLRHMIGLERPMGGRVLIEGVGEPDIEAEENPPFGVMFQSGALFGSMTLQENVALPLEQWSDLTPAAREVVARSKLRLVGLGGFENHLPAEISGGMKKRGGIARALALDPPLLFLDEPGAGLDPIMSVELDELILTLNRELGVTTVLVTHELDSILKVSNHCVMLDKEARGIIAEGHPRELKEQSSDPRVRDFFHRTSPARRRAEA